MASARFAAFLFAAGSLLTIAPVEAAPVLHGSPAAVPNDLISPVCHRGWHHRSGRPCGYGYGYRYGPPPGAPAYGYYRGPRYGYGGRVCRWRTDAWGNAVRVCRWR